ncbi:MAG: hypothetical protein ABIK93_02760 [candidate division WOR-3 bacterium]
MNQENQSTTKKCPFCAEEILTDAVKCKHCGEWLNKSLVEPQRVLSIVQQYSNAQAPWRFMLLSIVTFNFYRIYWFYRNWKHLKIHKNLKISPGWRTLGLFVPIYHIVLIYDLFRNIRNFARQSNCKTYSSPGLITFGYIFLNHVSFSLASQIWKSKVAAVTELSVTTNFVLLIIIIIINLLNVRLLAVVQKTLNNFWEKEQAGLEIRPKFTGKEIACLVIGGIFWILILIGIFIPE